MKISPQYVLDEIEWYEINSLFKYRHYSHKDSWEQARLITYMVAQVNSKKTLKLGDIISFPWEDDAEAEEQKVSAEDVKRLKQMAQDYLSNK